MVSSVRVVERILVIREVERVAALVEAGRAGERPPFGPGGAAVGPVLAADFGAPESVDADRQAAAPDLAAPQGTGILDFAAPLARSLGAGPGRRALESAPQHDVDRAGRAVGVQGRGAVAYEFDPFDGRNRQRLQDEGRIRTGYAAAVYHDDRGAQLGPVQAEIVVAATADQQLVNGRHARAFDILAADDMDRPHGGRAVRYAAADGRRVICHRRLHQGCGNRRSQDANYRRQRTYSEMQLADNPAQCDFKLARPNECPFHSSPC